MWLTLMGGAHLNTLQYFSSEVDKNAVNAVRGKQLVPLRELIVGCDNHRKKQSL